MLIVYCFLGTTVSLQLLICAMVIAIIGYFIGKPMFQMASKAGRGEINSLRDLSKDLSQGLRSFKSHKAMAKEKELLNSLSVANNNFLTANLIKVKAQHLLHASQQTLLIFSIIAGLLVAKDFFKITFVEIGFMTLVLMRLNAYTSNIFKKFLRR